MSTNFGIKLHYLLLNNRVRNQKTTINNKIRTIEQIFVLDPVK